MVLPGEKLHLAVVSLTNPLGRACVARADRDGGGDLSRVGNEIVGIKGVIVVVGDLGFKQSNLLLELLICTSECVGFNAMDGIAVLDSGNKSFGNLFDSFAGQVLGEYVDGRLGRDWARDYWVTWAGSSWSCQLRLVNDDGGDRGRPRWGFIGQGEGVVRHGSQDIVVWGEGETLTGGGVGTPGRLQHSVLIVNGAIAFSAKE